jgi:exodeoxyribonuclease VII large subunit
MSTLPLFDDAGRPRNGGGGGDADDRVYRVGALNRAVRLLLEDRFRNVWVEGELSDVTHAGSGHVYFTLNDENEQAQLRGVMFRSDAVRAKAKLENGARVKLRGTLSLFEPRGNFQMIARIALPQGLGELHAEFERIRKRLEKQGLLGAERKRPLPLLPRVLGVVTSADGAALHDVVQVASERCPVRIVVSPCLVQGRDAPLSIVAALERIQRLPGLDVVIVGRGGGSAEDLWAFNDERVALAVARCTVPVISAVGHEVDVSICDLVADVRASTPSNAAELAVPQRAVLVARVRALRRGLEYAMESRLARSRLLLDRRARRLSDPRAALGQARRKLERLGARLGEATRRRLRSERTRQVALAQRLARRDPRLWLHDGRQRLAALRSRLRRSLDGALATRRERFGELGGKLHALSPLGVLARGYAVVLHGASGRALLRAGDARPGETLSVRLHEGTLQVTVREATPRADEK